VASDTLNQLPGWVADLLGNERVAHLGVLDAHNRARVLPVTYAICEGALWTIVDNKPKRRGSELARLRWLRERPGAALTVDHYEDDWTALAWVQLIGHVEILEPRGHPTAVAALTSRYAQYISDPPLGPLLRFTVDRAVWWRAAGE
jgi:PPOX class probable F420-dependent enzyme